MTERKWTPGPWDVTKDGKHVCGAPDGDGMKPSVARYTNTNAHLIAAAPELYEALAAAMDEIGRMKPTEALVAVALSGRAALAKAEGHTP